ncbi:RNA-dependent RNA polymerase [Fusarium pseudograminearum megabirnavirus 1]|uniref:RNA-directed RNA polymerase n=1 Tax=Fusarium pseudograminearum megabirnavirus 1 TaxID=2478384 RepID=A0A499S5V4_9VIRU|nr:RNA-dependent RNA polymerase [Fusarium pseudograminearum megabirnavirus 1]
MTRYVVPGPESSVQATDYNTFFNTTEPTPGKFTRHFLEFLKTGVISGAITDLARVRKWFSECFPNAVPNWLMTAEIDAGVSGPFEMEKELVRQAKLASERVVVYMGSGGGKSTLGGAGDHDRILDASGLRPEWEKARAEALVSDDWSQANQLLRDAVRRQINTLDGPLFSWAPDAVPRELFGREVIVLQDGLIADDNHDQDIMDSNQKVLEDAAKDYPYIPVVRATGYVGLDVVDHAVATTQLRGVGRFNYSRTVSRSSDVQFGTTDVMAYRSTIAGNQLSFVNMGKSVWRLECVRGDLTHYIRSLLDGTGLSDRQCAKMLDAIFPVTEVALRERQRVDRRLLLKLVRSDLRHGVDLNEIASFLAKCSGLGWQAMANHYVAFRTAPLFSAWLSDFVGVFGWQGIKAYESRTKAVHGLARRGRRVVPVSGSDSSVRPADVMYINCLIGRYYLAEVASDSTVEDRVAYYGQHVAYDSVARQFTVEAHKRMMDEFYRERAATAGRVWMLSQLNSMEDFLMEYASFGASGSAGKGSGVRFNIEHAVSKRLWLSDLTAEEVVEILTTSEPGAHGVTVVKRESGKMRQLLPAPLHHWLAENLLVGEVESRIFGDMKEVVIEKSAIEELFQFHDRRKRVMAGDPIVCLDWADFNITHNLDDFAAYFLALGSAAKTHAHGEFIPGMDKGSFLQAVAHWCASAVYNMNMRNSADPDATEQLLNRGLWSGWRTTQFFNTSYNVAYSREAADFVRHHYGGTVNMSQHTGDDVVAFTDSCLTSMALIAGMSWMKHELQEAKQHIDSDVAEFLRVEYGRDGVVQGSLNRAISWGFVSSDTQSPIMISGFEQAVGTNESINQMIRRGGSIEVLESWRYIVVQHWATIKSIAGSATPSAKLLRLAVERGGYGCSRYGELHSLLPVHLGGWPNKQEHASDARVPRNAARVLHKLSSIADALGATISNPELLKQLVVEDTYGNDWPTDAKRRLDELHRIRLQGIICERNLKVAAISEAEFTSREPLSSGDLSDVARAMQLMADSEVPAQEPIDLNSTADAIRSMALGSAKMGDPTITMLKHGAAKMLPAAVIKKLSGAGGLELLSRMAAVASDYIIDGCLSHELNLPMSTGGVVPPALRCYGHFLVDSCLRSGRRKARTC